MAAFGTGSLGSPGLATASQDVAVQIPPTDTVSALEYSPAAGSNLMVAASWSGQVLCYDTGIQNNVLVSAGKAEQRHELALDCSWFADGSKVATCGGDRTLKVWDFASNKQLQLGSHAAPIKACNVLDRQVGNGNVVATGGWDKKLKYWDLSTQRSAGEVTLEEKVYAMDAREFLLVVATADQPAQAAQNLAPTDPAQQNKANADRTRKIYCFDLRKPSTPAKVELSPLCYQTRCVTAFPGNAGYLVGSIEGRVAVQNFEGMHPDKQASYTFKCHRRTLDANGNVVQGAKNTQYGTKRDTYDEINPINVMKFFPTGTFMTAGADGVYIMWDKDQKSRLQKPNPAAHLPITAATFNSSGNILAYALGYDWGQGHEYFDPNNQQHKPQIMLHRLNEADYQRRNNKPGAR